MGGINPEYELRDRRVAFWLGGMRVWMVMVRFLCVLAISALELDVY